MTRKRLQKQYLYCIDSIKLLEFLFAYYELFTFLLGMYRTINPECEVVDIRMEKLKCSRLQAPHKISLFGTMKMFAILGNVVIFMSQ